MIRLYMFFVCLLWAPVLASLATLFAWAVLRYRHRDRLVPVFLFSYGIVVLVMWALFHLTGASTSPP